MDEQRSGTRNYGILDPVARHRWDPQAPHVAVVHPRRIGPGLTPDQARGPKWRRTGSGLFVPADVDETPQQHCIEIAATLPAGAALTGWASCLLHGAAWFDGRTSDDAEALPVPVAVGPRGGVRRRREVAISFERLPEWEVWQRYGVRVTRPERAVFDEMRRQADEREALVVLESALAGRITSLQRMIAYVATHRGGRRIALVDWALARARGHVRSPLEVRVRTIAEEDAGWARTEVNRVVEDRGGRRVGEVDILDTVGALIEVDGADHRSGARQTHDITKEEALRGLGLGVTRVTYAHTLDAPALAARLRAVRGRALALDPAAREWRLRPRSFDVEQWLTDREATALWAEHLPDSRSA